MKSENKSVIYEKAYSFSRRIIKLYKFLCTKNEYVLSKQLLRSGTSIGANITEANYSISKKEFRNKMSIALKEAAESRYWISLLKDENYITLKQFESLMEDLEEIIKILVKVVKNAEK